MIMPKSTPKRSAHALPDRDCAPQPRRRLRAYQGLSDARCRELYQRSQGNAPASPSEHALFVRTHREFIDDVFNLDVDLDTKYPELEDGEL
jgi:hypothetical protein